MKKLVCVTNIPSPYQIKWSQELKKYYDVQFWFMIDIKDSATGRPNYWEVDLPKHCKVLPSKFKKYEICYGPTLVKELNDFNPDIVMVGGAWHMISWMQAYRWAVKNNKKITTTPIEFNKNLYRNWTIKRNKLIYKYLYGKVDLFNANAFYHYDYFVEVLGISNVALFMNYDDYKPYLKHPKRLKKRTITFLYGGAIDRRMRVPETIKTFEKIVSKYDVARLVIGGYGPEKEQCRDIVDNSSTLLEKVSFYDVKSWDEIPDVFARCDVLINFASYSPGAGVILSSVASGMGVISNISIHATRHFVIDNYNGFIVEDEKSLYKAMENYIENENLIEEHSKRSKSIGINTLTYEKHLEDFNYLITEKIFKD